MTSKPRITYSKVEFFLVSKHRSDRLAVVVSCHHVHLKSILVIVFSLKNNQVSRASVYKNLLENATRALLDKIPHLGEERMLLLLNDSFR